MYCIRLIQVKELYTYKFLKWQVIWQYLVMNGANKTLF